MKKIIAGTLMLAIPSFLFAQIRYTIKGKIDGLGARAMIYMDYAAGDTYTLDSTNIVNNEFTLTGFISEPVLVRLYLSHTGESFRSLKYPDRIILYLDSGQISLRSTGSLANATVNGPMLTNDYEELKQSIKPFEARTAAVKAEEKKLRLTNYSAQKEAELDKRYQSVDDDRIPVLEAFIERHPKSMVSIDALWMRGGNFPDPNVVDPIFRSLSDVVKETTAGKAFAQLLTGLKRTVIGAQAPVFTQNDQDGKPISLHEFKGKYVLIDFWASWCGPCRKENPDLVKTYNLYKNKNFTILGVSLDLRKEAWLKAIRDDNLTWTQVSDLNYWKNQAAILYAVHAIPQNFLIDPSGKIIGKNITHEDLMAQLKNFLEMPVYNAK